eukprot:5476275-Prymnesium_polylepis.1
MGALLGAEREQRPAAAASQRKLRLLDVQVQLRLAVAALDASADPSVRGPDFRELKKLVQLYA